MLYDEPPVPGPETEPVEYGVPMGLGETITDLYNLIRVRQEERPAGSYTVELLDQQDKALKKVGEEAAEVIIAAKGGDAGELRWEAADLIYHLLVVLVSNGVTLDEIADELQRRRK
jgi:phosphoribosyl-ATP pyrophosphohydrolase/phosphoribosyl-AMP cyclohydrolase